MASADWYGVPLIRYAVGVRLALTMLGAFADVTRNGRPVSSVRAAARAALAQIPPSAPATSEPFSAFALSRPVGGVAAVVVGDERDLLPDHPAAHVEVRHRQLRAVDEVRPALALRPRQRRQHAEGDLAGTEPRRCRGRLGRRRLVGGVVAAEQPAAREPESEKHEGAGSAGAPLA